MTVQQQAYSVSVQPQANYLLVHVAGRDQEALFEWWDGIGWSRADRVDKGAIWSRGRDVPEENVRAVLGPEKYAQAERAIEVLRAVKA